MSKISFLVSLLFGASVDTSIPTYHLNFNFLLFLFVNFLCGRAIDLLIDANNDCSIRVSRSFARCLGSKARGKAAACKAKRSLLTYLTRPIVLCDYPEKYTPLRVQHPGYPDLRAILRTGYVTHIKLAFQYNGVEN